jgi:hypothetical protein
MRKKMTIRAVMAMALMSVFLVAWPGAASADAQPAAASSSYENIMALKNRITNECLADDAETGLQTRYCSDDQFPSVPDFEQWGLTSDGWDDQGHEIVTLQNLATGSCLDDSAAYGLRGYLCDPHHDSLRIFQQFRITFLPDGWVLQNLATGSCVDDSAAYGLRGYFCNGTYFQDWTASQAI